MDRILVIGGGIGGLSAAAILAKNGFQVTVLEAHIYAGGSAGTFYHQGYRFDAGATLAGGFAQDGPMQKLADAAGIPSWPVRRTELAMRVHLPDQIQFDRWSDERRWEERKRVFSPESEGFWHWQEATADLLWKLSGRGLPWPPRNLHESSLLVKRSLPSLRKHISHHAISWILDGFRPIHHHLPVDDEKLKLFLDAQLLISAQTTSVHANALYSAAALDLPRRGVVHVEGGMGALAETLVETIRNHGGEVIYRQEVKRIERRGEGNWVIGTSNGREFLGGTLIANLTPWNIKELLGEEAPSRFRDLTGHPQYSWGAFVAYVGVDSDGLPNDLPIHQQVITGMQLAEGNSVFLSLSPPWDSSRAPEGHRALTISTHTRLNPWWDLFKNDPSTYDARRESYVEKLLEVGEIAIPGLRNAARVILPGTPLTFQRFTRRKAGWVGGFPQTSLFRTWHPRIRPGFWMVGDSIFPGQSVAAVAMGGARVANAVVQEQTPEPAIHHSYFRRIGAGLSRRQSTTCACFSTRITDKPSLPSGLKG